MEQTTTLSKNEIREQVQQTGQDYAQSKHRCGLAISMGVGKTRIALRDMQRINAEHIDKRHKYLVAIPRTSITTSYFDETIAIDDPELFQQIEFVNYRSIHKIDLAQYAKIYLDECHSLKFSHEFFLDMYGGPLLGLTGTPPRYEKSEKGYMVNKFCPIVYTYNPDEAISDSVLNDYRIFIHQLELNANKTFKIELKDGRSWMTSEVENYINHCEKLETLEGFGDAQKARIFRLASMKKYPTKFDYLRDILIPRLIKQDFKFLVFTNTKDQADQLASEFGSYHSGNPDSAENMDRFKKAEKGYMTCVDQIKEGVTIPGLNSAIIMHAYGNERNASQKLGRILRLSPDLTAIAHILMFDQTVDQQWVMQSLKDFDFEKIRIFNPKSNKAHKVSA